MNDSGFIDKKTGEKIELTEEQAQKFNPCRQHFYEIGPHRYNITDNPSRLKILEMLIEVIQDTMQVFDFGAKKHPDSGDTPNFLTPEGNKCSLKERGSGVLRHAARTFMNPGMKDEESGLEELLHLLASASILYIRQKRNIVHTNDA